MSQASRPSEITLPANNNGWATVYAFLCEHFHRIAPEIWQARIGSGKVHWFGGEAITLSTPYLASRRLCYYREVSAEPMTTAAHHILLQNDHIVVACKPHGLPVTPGGDFVNECLLERVRRDTGCNDIAPVHRLDKDTAGLVLFSVNATSRAQYYELFAKGQIAKSYLAVAAEPTQFTQHEDDLALPRLWHIRNRIEKSEPRFVMKICEGEPNAHSTIQQIAHTQCSAGAVGLYALTPHTGKTHQLRLHMASIGRPILGDRYYPQLLPKLPTDAPNTEPAMPLQLLAAKLAFIDPVSCERIELQSARRLAGWPLEGEATR